MLPLISIVFQFFLSNQLSETSDHSVPFSFSKKEIASCFNWGFSEAKFKTRTPVYIAIEITERGEK